MILARTHPEIAFRSCESCQAFVYDDDGSVAQFRGEPIPRPGHLPTPCKTDVGCPKGSPDAGIALSKRNHKAVAFHRRCEAVGRWPADPIVERNAAIIKSADAEADDILRERDGARRKREKDR